MPAFKRKMGHYLEHIGLFHYYVQFSKSTFKHLYYVFLDYNYCMMPSMALLQSNWLTG